MRLAYGNTQKCGMLNGFSIAKIPHNFEKVTDKSRGKLYDLNFASNFAIVKDR